LEVDDDRMMRVISLTEKDEQGKPKVLAEYQAGVIGVIGQLISLQKEIR
jgi:hypothetical protein